jgi:undecaprenyl-diphosphatase
MTIRRLEHMSYAAALFIGLAQVLALIPGASRSGVTMTAARMIGFERADAARFSLLLSIPAILGAATLAGLNIHQTGDLELGFDAAIAAGIAFLAALISISVMMAWLRHAGFMPFVIYRLLLGGALLVWIYL